ncbi:MAG: hypothetical protein H6510_13725 [Acidobacteria bacterium]|nr:hypothetical protein [Acidobacteriota bacterium]MCB9398867.1 hypothetical protein [Acidobacteriota bacterium]
MAFSFFKKISVPLVILACFCQCQTDPDKTLRMELQKSFNTFLKSVEVLDEEGLNATVFIPGAKRYRAYVINLLSAYQQQLGKGEPITFDPQGIVLVRFLGIGHHRYQVVSVERNPDGKTVNMRISVNFSFDNTVRWGGFEPGTTVYIPKEPWGTYNTVVIGDNNNALPRSQLKRCEIDLTFHITNMESYWQLRSGLIDENSLESEESFTSL